MSAHPVGTRFGPYEILGLVGEGGMGAVYRARDTRLDRTVALKVSKEQFTPRFETEARATAALEHPHICRLYDVCHEEGVSFLVMEYVDGKPLTGPLPLDRVLDYARQIVSALDEAHRKQIVHRDLKPSNILITCKGGVKLLDFGLAKLGSRSATLDDEALTRGITAAGTILGTLHYMSPEQLQGGVADARSDIFAFGLVLYEMLTGKRAFEGASAASVIAAILERPAPSVSTVAPSALDRLLQRCLAKDPDERWQSARDVKAALDLIVEPVVSVQSARPSSVRRTTIWPWMFTGIVTASLAALAFVHFREIEPEPTLVRFQVPVPQNVRTTAPIVSPDGRHIAFVATSREGATGLWVRRLDTLESLRLAGTENVSGNIFWSADSRSLAFVADNYLKTIEVSGREIRTLTEVTGNIGGGTWNADGLIIFSRFLGGLHRISASGGTSTALSTPSGGLHLAPTFLPDGRHFIYVATGQGGNTARVATLEGATVSEFPIPSGSSITYAPPLSPGQDGHFLFSRGATLYAQSADPRTLTPKEQPVPIADDLAVGAAPGQSPTFYSVSSTGALVYLAGSVLRPTQVMWFDRTGKQQATVWSQGVYNDVSLSPDDTRVALTKRESPNDDDIWLVDLERNVPTRFTSDRAQDWHPVWSPDGKRLAFSSTRVLGGTGNSVFWKDAINVNPEQLVLKSTTNDRVNDWSPDGRLLLINRTEGRDGLFIVPIDSSGPTAEDKVITYVNSPNFTETRGQFYPVARGDARSWILYTSNESGEYEVYVESYPRGTQKQRISANGGTQPRWRRDGKELFYISPDLKLMAVDVTAGETLTFGQPRELFQTRISLGGTLAFRMLRYDVTRDGKRFLINSELEGTEAASTPITVVLNWQESLNR